MFDKFVKATAKYDKVVSREPLDDGEIMVGESLGLFTQIGDDANVAPVQLPPLHVSRLQQLGFDIAQVARMLPAERRRCIDEGLTDVGRSVLPNGTVQDVPGAGEHNDGSEGTVELQPDVKISTGHIVDFKCLAHV